jgi:hypothetical protein
MVRLMLVLLGALSVLASVSCTNIADLKSFYNNYNPNKSVSSTAVGRNVTLNINDDVKMNLDTDLQLKLKLKLKAPKRQVVRRSPTDGSTVWSLVGMSPDGVRYASAFDSSGNASVTLPTNKMLSLYIEEVYTGYTNAMLLSYPDGVVSFKNGPSTSGTTDAIPLGTPTVTTDGRCVAAAQPDSNICTSGNGVADAAVYTNISSMDRYGTGVLDIFSVLDANQDGIPDAYEIGAGMLPKPAVNGNGNIGSFVSTNTNSPAVVLALTVDPNTEAYTNAPLWSNAQVNFALNTNFNNLRTNYLSDWSNSVVAVAINSNFQTFVGSNLAANWTNAAAAVVALPAFTSLVPTNQIAAFTNLQNLVTNNVSWAAQSNVTYTSSGVLHSTNQVSVYLALSPIAATNLYNGVYTNIPMIVGDLGGALVNGSVMATWDPTVAEGFMTYVSNVTLSQAIGAGSASCQLWKIVLSVPFTNNVDKIIQFKFVNTTSGFGSSWANQAGIYDINGNPMESMNRPFDISNSCSSQQIWMTNAQTNAWSYFAPEDPSGIIEFWESTGPTYTVSVNLNLTITNVLCGANPSNSSIVQLIPGVELYLFGSFNNYSNAFASDPMTANNGGTVNFTNQYNGSATISYNVLYLNGNWSPSYGIPGGNVTLPAGTATYTITNTGSWSGWPTIVASASNVTSSSVAVSSTASSSSSSSGVAANWTSEMLPSSQPWYSVTYGNGNFVAVPYGSSTAAISTNGIDWIAYNLPSSQNWTSVSYGNGTFVTVANSTTFAAISPDGITWTAETLPNSACWDTITFGNGNFVAIAGGSNFAATSPDGISWTTITLPVSSDWDSVTYGNGTFVAVAHGTNIAIYSTNGSYWTACTLPCSQYWYAITFGNGTFAAIAWNTNIAATSSDGINWTQQTLPSSQDWSSITYGNGTFVAVNQNTNIVATSTNGVNWITQTMPDSLAWQSVTFGNGTFVTIPYNGGIAAISH